MSDVVREDRQLTQLGFMLLLAWLDDGVESHGERYLEVRRRLVAYFDRRNRSSAEDLADETLNRIGRTLEQDGTIVVKPPVRYCYTVAKFVLLEDIRYERRQTSLDTSTMPDAATDPTRSSGSIELASIREQRLDCLDRCLDELKAGQRELIVEYYADSRRQKIERRKDLARRLGISMNALGIRACRIRDTLMACVEGCRRRCRQI